MQWSQSRRSAAAACRELGVLGGLVYHETGGDDIARSYITESDLAIREEKRFAGMLAETDKRK